MRYYFAPLEGLTDRIYRRVHHKHFSGVDRYYMPFLSPTQSHSLSAKEKRELPMASEDVPGTIPQILSKVAEDFLWAAQLCAERGYEEVNLNMGCPSGTVTAKGKGAGMLKDLGTLRQFMDAIFSATPLPISVKTRIGMTEAEEFSAILPLLNDYPIRELTVHPRVGKQFYKGEVDLSTFAYAVEHSKAPLCYNGDLCSREDIEALSARFPTVEAVMIGRGMIANPGMLTGIMKEQLRAFHTELLESYCETFQSEHNAMCRMKELWSLMVRSFDDSEKQAKALRKARHLPEFEAIIQEILNHLPLRCGSL